MTTSVENANKLSDILCRHEIPEADRAEFLQFVECGEMKSTSGEFRKRIKLVANYRAALDEIIELFSAPLRNLFEPQHFVSLA